MTGRFPVLALALAALLVGCSGGGGAPSPIPSTGAVASPSASPTIAPTAATPAATENPEPPPSPAPRILTPAHTGGTFSLRVGQTSTWVLSDPTAPEPVLTGDSVLLIPVANIQAGGRREWELRGVRPGVSELASASAPGYRLTLVVEA